MLVLDTIRSQHFVAARICAGKVVKESEWFGFKAFTAYKIKIPPRPIRLRQAGAEDLLQCVRRELIQLQRAGIQLIIRVF